MQRIVHKVYTNGQLTHTAHGAEVQFHDGPPLVIGPHIVRDYELLIAAIEDGSRRQAGGRGPAARRPFGL